VTEKFKVIIPARLGSTRLPGKMLLMISRYATRQKRLVLNV